ncbi:tautomerase family protein [Actinomyces procaprae]|uniref:tautomerase family protein n=1 Tax=Actinomyces procaprae TaxID=2560010 RepID=UPI00109DFFC6|nr:tautomerase family protein [Actinomyces procaprae]
MPLVTIELSDALSQETRRKYADAIHEGLVEGLGMDREDRFQVIHALPKEQIIAHPTYLGGRREDVVIVRVLMVRMYGVEQKRAMYQAVARHLEAAGARPDDVFIAVTENQLEDWYPGARGERG